MTDIKKREKWIDLARGVGIILVIIGHSCGEPHIRRFIYGFHMPLFFFISGFVYSSKNDDSSNLLYFKKTAKQYLLPYFLLSFVGLVLDYGLRTILGEKIGIEIIKRYIKGIFIASGSAYYTSTWGAVWFLVALFFALNFFHAIRKLPEEIRGVVCLGVMPLIDYCCIRYHIPMYWNIGAAMMAVFFIYLGNKTREISILDRFDCFKYYTTKWIVVLLIFCLGVYAIFTNLNVDVVAWVGNTYGNIVLMWVGALSIIFILLIVCKDVCKKLLCFRIIEYVSWLGKNTLLILGLHYLMIYYLYLCPWLADFNMGENTWIIVSFIDILYVTVLILVWQKVKKIRFLKKRGNLEHQEL